VSAPDGAALISLHNQPPVALIRYVARALTGRGGRRPDVDEAPS
jgi:hypothetical protein